MSEVAVRERFTSAMSRVTPAPNENGCGVAAAPERKAARARIAMHPNDKAKAIPIIMRKLSLRQKIVPTSSKQRDQRPFSLSRGSRPFRRRAAGLPGQRRQPLRGRAVGQQLFGRLCGAEAPVGSLYRTGRVDPLASTQGILKQRQRQRRRRTIEHAQDEVARCLTEGRGGVEVAEARNALQLLPLLGRQRVVPVGGRLGVVS